MCKVQRWRNASKYCFPYMQNYRLISFLIFRRKCKLKKMHLIVPRQNVLISWVLSFFVYSDGLHFGRSRITLAPRNCHNNIQFHCTLNKVISLKKSSNTSTTSSCDRPPHRKIEIINILNLKNLNF